MKKLLKRMKSTYKKAMSNRTVNICTSLVMGAVIGIVFTTIPTYADVGEVDSWIVSVIKTFRPYSSLVALVFILGGGGGLLLINQRKLVLPLVGSVAVGWLIIQYGEPVLRVIFPA
ncbi:hypothetical protein G7062_10535 [Erysipelothrix sp. HDW6C]|uniref:hypothetical protein n=1 Tax=Erysipelothrix sp. HDW6C TaxID=2714930 RepID=UPI0014078949|nr:hypothetical protein [Erysipelothrix sp. HDW6C]QIK70713.1 hypothetical protein G7062_10535 [Erysipelothrix sp. HDW6C]